MKRLSTYFVLFLLLLISVSRKGIAQSVQPGIFAAPAVQDSVNEADTVIHKGGLLTLFEGEPGRAALYGLLIPAGGQIYNRKWWKVPLALGIDGGLAYILISNTRNYNLSQQDYTVALANPGTGDINRLRARRDFYRKWREYAWVWMIAGHLLTTADAYVDRHLMNFDVSPDLSWYAPGIAPGSSLPGLTLAIPLSAERTSFSKKSTHSLP